MDERRIIEFAKLAPTRSRPPDVPRAPFDFLRAACQCLAGDLDHRPTLVLLDDNDVADGILETLLGLDQAQAPNPQHDLSRDIDRLAAAAAGGPFALVLCMAQPSLEAWEGPEWPGSAKIKDHEFFVRLFENYGLCMLMGNIKAPTSQDEPPTADDLERAVARLRRCLHRRAGRAGMTNWLEHRTRLQEDARRLFSHAKGVMGLSASFDRRQFLYLIARIDQFGKRPIDQVEKGIDRESDAGRSIVAPFKGGSYGLRRHLDKVVQAGQGEEISALFKRLREYELLRDCARWLGDGAFPWARDWRRAEARAKRRPNPLDSDGGGKPLLALFIDENLGPPQEQPAHEEAQILRSRIAEVFSLLFDDGRFELNVICDADGALPSAREHEQIGESIVDIDRFFERTLPKRIYRAENVKLDGHGTGCATWAFSELGADAARNTRTLHDYDVIFCEIDYHSRFAGPQIVQKLHSYLERTAAGRRSAILPAIIVLTHMDNIGHVQQCLNLGAQAFVNKERLFQIPSRLKRALADVQAVADDGTLMPRERFGQHSNFRFLYSLRPDRTAHLRNDNIRLQVLGGWSPHGDLSHGSLRRGIFDRDGQDRDWIRRLPKADLHCHFGTSISLATVDALALNTCGHLFRNWSGESQIEGMLSDPVRQVIKQVCRIVLRAAGDRRKHEGAAEAAAITYLRATEKILDRRPAPRGFDDPYGQIVGALMATRPPIKEHMVVALLVAVTAHLRPGDARAKAAECWTYFTELADWCKQASPEAGDRRDQAARAVSWPAWIEAFVVPVARQADAATEALRKSIGPLPAADDVQEQQVWSRLREREVSPQTCERLWAEWHRNIMTRLEAASRVIERFLRAACEEMNEGDISELRSHAPSLEELVVLPQRPASGDHHLLRYLWGCGLLGADHLQYPENIVLATHDVVHQNVVDNVVYSEVRCETPGYTRAGMTPEMVTDLLCTSFDLAEAFEREFKQSSFVRTNILLAAKRHKREEDIEVVVSLLSAYLKRPRRSRPIDKPTEVPSWWQPTNVVGFDLSGNEDKSPEGLRRQIGRLIELSSPITIHAGEAASAESVWQAVYAYHARRIGHGLRLRERGELLQFCINEGICMEMCPISNNFTSDFVQIDKDDVDDDLSKYDAHRIEHYPLRHFMEAGLEVCINTDNRSLHGSYGSSVTDEYLWAARLSGGLTRWEILKLVKAGFKHAFIDKGDARELIQAVENWTFMQVANAPGLDWLPIPRARPADSPKS